MDLIAQDGYSRDAFAEVLNRSIDIFTEEDEVDDEDKRTAEVFAVFKDCVRTGIHHAFFRGSGLDKMGLFPGVDQTTGHVRTEDALADVLLGESLVFVNIRAMRILSVTGE